MKGLVKVFWNDLVITGISESFVLESFVFVLEGRENWESVKVF